MHDTRLMHAPDEGLARDWFELAIAAPVAVSAAESIEGNLGAVVGTCTCGEERGNGALTVADVHKARDLLRRESGRLGTFLGWSVHRGEWRGVRFVSHDEAPLGVQAPGYEDSPEPEHRDW